MPKRRLNTVTQRMVTRQLRALEADGLVDRRVYPVVPPKVECSLTPRGRTLEPVIRALAAWGDAHVLNLSPATKAAKRVRVAPGPRAMR